MIVALLPSQLSARTITLTDSDCELIAVICSQAPRSGWAAFPAGLGDFSTYLLDIQSTRSFLIKYPLDGIPPGQRIVKAEWTLPLNYLNQVGEQRLDVRRMTSEWGPGVCHQYRMTAPKKLEWAEPGARGVGTDRAARPSVLIRTSMSTPQTINVTQDVELWYAGGTPNFGWMVSVDDPNLIARFGSPIYSGKSTWKLRITYEPE